MFQKYYEFIKLTTLNQIVRTRHKEKGLSLMTEAFTTTRPCNISAGWQDYLLNYHSYQINYFRRDLGIGG